MRVQRIIIRIFAVMILLVIATCGGGSADQNNNNNDDDQNGFLPDSQADNLEDLRAASSTPLTFRFDKGIPETVFMKVPIPEDLEDDEVVHALDFFEKFKDFYSLPDPTDQLYLKRAKIDDDNNEKHMFFRQKHNDIPVFGATLAIHMIGGNVVATSGRYVGSFPPLSGALVSMEDAIQAAIDNAPGTDVESSGVPILMYFDESLFNPDVASDVHLTWRVPLVGFSNEGGHAASWLAFVDAIDSEVLFYINETPTDSADKDIDIQTANNTMSSSCWDAIDETADDDWYNEDGENGYDAGADPLGEGPAAYNLSHSTYDYFFNLFHRHSWDNDEEQVEVMVRVIYDDGPNATFNPSCEHMSFSDGYVINDVFAHEWGHGIDNYEGNLIYQNQSGALDESFADFWGAMIEGGDWIIGEDLPGGALRDMSDPTIFSDPDSMANFVVTTNDNGGVHTNSGIPNKVAFLVTEGGQHNGYKTFGMGQTKAERLYYDVLVNYISSNTMFANARDLFVGVAQIYLDNNQYGFAGIDVCDVKNAWASVGINTGGADSDCDGNPDSIETDDDNDGTPDGSDNCPTLSNPGQYDIDGDNIGDRCDNDIDDDGLLNEDDNCPKVSNVDQDDTDDDGVGDLCDDSDGDGFLDIFDNCPDQYNYTQEDLDGDGIGDGCDDDLDGDGVINSEDNCPRTDNDMQEDIDADTLGDACDNCPSEPNVDQMDCDHNGVGTACDTSELPLPGDCGKIHEVAINRFVHPLDLVTIGICDGCPDWLGPDFRISVNVTVDDGFDRQVRIVDDRGHTVKSDVSGRGTQNIVFRPSSDFSYRPPNSTVDYFQGRQYFIQFGESEFGPGGTFEAELSVEFGVQ